MYSKFENSVSSPTESQFSADEPGAASSFSLSYHCSITHTGHENEEKDLKMKGQLLKDSLDGV